MTFEVAHVSVIRGGHSILSDVNLGLRPGQLCTIVGPNGAGKSTLLRVLTGEMAPDQGEMRVQQRSAREWSERQLSAVRSVLPQSSHLAFPFTVHEVVALGIEAAARARHLAHDPRMATKVLARVGLAGYGARFYQTLSGGEQQRVQFARVLCQASQPLWDAGPHWLFLDEPTANLDIKHQIAILDIAREWAQSGGGVLTILHDLNLAALYADRLIVMQGGRIVADGSVAAVLTDNLLDEVFGLPLKLNRTPKSGSFVLPHSIREG